MGYLTTITFYNDAINLLKEHAEDFSKRVYFVVSGIGSRKGAVEIPLGEFSNFAKIQISRHADDNTVYVHCGNTVSEMNYNSDETRKIMKNNPKFFSELLNEMKKQIEVLEYMNKNQTIEE